MTLKTAVFASMPAARVSSDGCEAGALCEHAESVADVLPQIVHRCTSDDDRCTQRGSEMFSSGDERRLTVEKIAGEKEHVGGALG